MSDESKSRIVLVLVSSFFAFQAGVYCQRRIDRWNLEQRAAYDRAAAQYEAHQHASAPEPVLLNGVWFCNPPSKWHAQWIQRQDGGSDAVVCARITSPPKGNPNDPFLPHRSRESASN